MVEILFGESESASMKAAKSKRVIGSGKNGPVSIIGKAGGGQELQNEEVRWIHGTSEEVVCLGFMLDIGDIREAANGDCRKKQIVSMLCQDQWGEGREMEEELEKAFDAYGNELLRLKTYLEDGQPVRIWYSDAPYARCGLCFVCHFMKDFENSVSAVKMPEYRVNEKNITRYHNWGNVAAEEFSYFLQYETALSAREQRMYEMIWSKLTEENAPLRAVVNGELVSAQEDFYDFLIWRHLTDRPVKEARLIGDILGHHPVSVGDWWYAARIQRFIEKGQIRIVEDSKRRYARMICRAD